MKARKERNQLIYTNKLLDILACDFISATKVSNFQSDVQELLGYAEWMTNRYDDCKEELEKVQNELDSFMKEYKIEREEHKKEDKPKEESKDKPKQGAEIEIIHYKLYSQIKLKIEVMMGIKKKEKLLSNTMTQILRASKGYDSIHIKLIYTLMEYLKPLEKQGTKNLNSKRAEDVIREILVDFLFRFKDKHPFKNPQEGKVMNTFNTVMEFMYKYGFEPSESLKEEYRNSKTNKKLTTFPSYEYLSSKFENGFPIEKYEFMKMRFESGPPFVFYFDPDMQLEEYFGIVDDIRIYYIEFCSKGTNKAIGAGFCLDEEGFIYQGYYKDGKAHNYGRDICDNGDIYEGGYNMGKRHGKVWKEYYEDGEREVGQWINDKPEGEFKWYDKQGNITIKHYKDGEEVEN